MHLLNRNQDDDPTTLNSLKTRMTSAVEPAERAISTCPQGSWLDGLRTSFEPDTGPQAGAETGRKPKAKLIAGRLRSV